MELDPTTGDLDGVGGHPFLTDTNTSLSNTNIEEYLLRPKAQWVTEGRPKGPKVALFFSRTGGAFPKAGDVYLFHVASASSLEEARTKTLDWDFSWNSDGIKAMNGVVKRYCRVVSSPDSDKNMRHFRRHEAWMEDDPKYLLVHYREVCGRKKEATSEEKEEVEKEGEGEKPKAKEIVNKGRTHATARKTIGGGVRKKVPLTGKNAGAKSGGFQLGDLVWSKVKGFPWWPSVIEEIKWLKKEGSGPLGYRVEFFGTWEEALLKAEDLRPYNNKTRAAFGRPRKIRFYNQALYEVEAAFRQKIPTDAEFNSEKEKSYLDDVIKLLEMDLKLKESLTINNLKPTAALAVMKEIAATGHLENTALMIRACPVVVSLLKIRGWKNSASGDADFDSAISQAVKMLGTIGKAFSDSDSELGWLVDFRKELSAFMAKESLYQNFYEPLFTTLKSSTSGTAASPIKTLADCR